MSRRVKSQVSLGCVNSIRAMEILRKQGTLYALSCLSWLFGHREGEACLALTGVDDGAGVVAFSQ